MNCSIADRPIASTAQEPILFTKIICCLSEYVAENYCYKPSVEELAQLTRVNLGEKEVLFSTEDEEREVYRKIRE